MLLLMLPLLLAAQAQSRPDLYQCEGCEAIYEHDLKNLPWRATISPPNEPGTRLALAGRVYKSDGVTPAAGVVIYIHHTNAAGVYPRRGNEEGWGRRHGYLRGWVMSNDSGEYRFDTIRPAPYPGRRDPAHIHMTVKEPSRREYWIDEVVFTDDSLVTVQYRAREERRGGSGIVAATRQADGTWLVRRDIRLEP